LLGVVAVGDALKQVPQAAVCLLYAVPRHQGDEEAVGQAGERGACLGPPHGRPAATEDAIRAERHGHEQQAGQDSRGGRRRREVSGELTPLLLSSQVEQPHALITQLAAAAAAADFAALAVPVGRASPEN
jgi:hypothetical protein